VITINAIIPKEIREYKEKLIAGLNARQLISTIVAIGICVPLYIHGRRYLPEELISWLVIIVALPLGGIGFFKYNGMPAERFVLCIAKFMIYPINRVNKASNILREWQEQTRKEDLIREGFADAKGRLRNRARKYFLSASYERSFLIEEKLRNNIDLRDIDFSKLDEELITTQTASFTKLFDTIGSYKNKVLKLKKTG
jgi:hypothetical protein